MAELKPCPFCGGKAKICATTTRTYPKNHGKHWCYCEKCGATGQSFSDFEDDGSSVFKAIEAWNRRADAELVRCRDCRYFHNGYDEKCCISHRGVVVTDENGFCHHGVRRKFDE